MSRAPSFVPAAAGRSRTVGEFYPQNTATVTVWPCEAMEKLVVVTVNLLLGAAGCI
jgi:hypothetical protein